MKKQLSMLCFLSVSALFAPKNDTINFSLSSKVSSYCNMCNKVSYFVPGSICTYLNSIHGRAKQVEQEIAGIKANPVLKNELKQTAQSVAKTPEFQNLVFPSYKEEYNKEMKGYVRTPLNSEQERLFWQNGSKVASYMALHMNDCLQKQNKISLQPNSTEHCIAQSLYVGKELFKAYNNKKD